MAKFALFRTKKITPCAVLMDSKMVEYPIHRLIGEVLKEEFYKIDYINGYRDVYASSFGELIEMLRADYECDIVEIE